MANTSVNYLHDLINQQIDYQEDLSDYLSKADALVTVALSNNFLDCSDEIKRNYFWVLSDILDSAKMINEQTLSLLFERQTPNAELNSH